MKYIDVKVKKTGKVINIMEAEYDESIYSKDVTAKVGRKPAATKEEKAAPERKTKEAKVITSESMKRAN